MTIKTTQITLRLPKGLALKLKAEAEQLGMPLSGLLRSRLNETSKLEQIMQLAAAAVSASAAAGAMSEHLLLKNEETVDAEDIALAIRESVETHLRQSKTIKKLAAGI